MLPPEFAPLIPTVTEVIALTIFVFVAIGILGRFLNSVVGEFLLEIPFLLLTCLAFYILFGLIGVGLKLSPNQITWVANAGLVIGAAVASIWEVWGGRKNGTSEPGKRRGAWFFLCLWLGFCFVSWIGHAAGGWLGLLVITAPAMLGFWLLLHYLARFILPLDEGQSVSEALRCLLTFSAGTNYPYYVLENREKVERVPGNQFRQDPLRGPTIYGTGVFLTGPDHILAVSNGFKFAIRGPGVVFTQLFETIQEPMDLQPQQRPYTVEATTKDGICLEFNTFGPFQLDAGEQQPELGKPFPFRKSSVFKAFHAQSIDIKRDKLDGEVVEKRVRRRWDELYEMIGTHVMQDIISGYKFDELYEPLDPAKDPRKDIAAEYREKMREELPRRGIRIPGGGISNLMPADKDTVFNQRITSWQAQWQRK
ncbi:MAG: hypothetical protein KKC18_12515, partial [Chloroflexi bacterium]|nr:hypothetical protein [Chloroflexota bacterium]